MRSGSRVSLDVTQWAQPVGEATMSFDVERIRKDFPILNEKVHGRQLVYLDNAATTQKPQALIDAITQYYSFDNSNVHRGIHALSERATQQYEGARARVGRFINSADPREIIFVRGATEGINLVAHSYARPRLQAGDEILITAMEHHSNIVPWQILCDETGALLRVTPINDDGELLLEEFEKLLSPKTKLVAIVHVSNALGTINPLKQMIRIAHSWNVPVLVDGAQAAPHLKVDVQELDCDFYVFSGHKVYGPTGIGVLYGKTRLLEEMVPYQGGGDMISSVTFERTTFNVIPYKFEAGTPNVAGVVGLGAAIDYVEGIGLDAIAAHEHRLLTRTCDALSGISGLRLIGRAREKTGVQSFVMDRVHAHDVGTILDREGVAIRAGHHCAMPLMDRFGVTATCRASFAMYNTNEEIDALVSGIHKVREVFG